MGSRVAFVVIMMLVMIGLPVPVQATEATPTRARCATAWFEYQYADIAPGFPSTMSPRARKATYQQCLAAARLPSENEKVRLTQKAYNTVAQIIEREVRRVSVEQGLPPCEALYPVLKPVDADRQSLTPTSNRDVEGYARDSFLPILRHNWWSGPFRLKWAVGCFAAPYANLWLTSDPWPNASSHPDQYPSRAESKKNPWNRKPVESRVSTCISWGPGLGNDVVGGKGRIFGFEVTDENLPRDVRSCYPRAMGEDGLGKFPFTNVPNLP